MSITPKAIQDLLDELEASRQARRRAWDVLQDLRVVLTNLGNVTIEVPFAKNILPSGPAGRPRLVAELVVRPPVHPTSPEWLSA